MEFPNLLIKKSKTYFGDRSQQLSSPANKINNFNPTILGWYTKDKNGEYQGEDESLLKYVFIPKNLKEVNFDLNASHELDDYKIPKKYKFTGKIDTLFHWIVNNSANDLGGPKRYVSLSFYIVHSVFNI
jgi:hypothetical protein